MKARAGTLGHSLRPRPQTALTLCGSLPSAELQVKKTGGRREPVASPPAWRFHPDGRHCHELTASRFPAGRVLVRSERFRVQTVHSARWRHVSGGPGSSWDVRCLFDSPLSVGMPTASSLRPPHRCQSAAFRVAIV